MVTVGAGAGGGGIHQKKKIEPPLRPSLSISFEPAFSVKVPVETSRHSAEIESNSQPGLRSHMALIRGASVRETTHAVPKASALGLSTLYRNTPRPGITAL